MSKTQQPENYKKSALTRTVREQIERVFNMLQGSEHDKQPYQLVEWAKKHPGEFYRIAAALVPKQLQHQGGITLKVSTGVPDAEDISDLA